MKEERSVSIQLVRACACLMVFTVHFGQRVGFSGTLKAITDFGRFGVHLFFLISGFLAGKTFLTNPNVDIKQYYFKRIIAILPLYYLVIAFYFITENIMHFMVPCIPEDTLGLGWIRYLLLLNGFLNIDTSFWSNLGFTWSIPVFMFFYLVAPFVLKKVNSIPSSVLLWLGVYAVTDVLEAFHPCYIFANLHLLFLGVVLYVCASRKKCLTAAIIFSCGAIGMLILNKTDFVYVAIMASVFLVLVSFDHIPLPKWLETAVNILDRYSYTFYLVHGIVFCSLLDRIIPLGAPSTMIAGFAIIGTFLSTWVVGRYIEKPLQSWLRKIAIK